MGDTTSSDYPCNCRSCGTIISPSVTDMCEECEIAVERNYKKFYTPMTDTTPKFDPIPRLQQIAATIRDSGADTFDAPATAAYYIECAINEIERLRRDYSCICNEMRRMMEERDEARLQTRRILNEIDCRIEHGADSNGHLEAIYNLFKENSNV